MLSWWCQRKERRQQVIRDADNLMVIGVKGTGLVISQSSRLPWFPRSFSPPHISDRQAGPRCHSGYRQIESGFRCPPFLCALDAMLERCWVNLSRSC
jgi:hypothetical protein